VIAQAKFAEGVEVLRLHGAQRSGSKDMIEAILELVPVTPAPSLLPCLLAIAMQPPIDIVQIVSAQLTQHAQLKFVLTVKGFSPPQAALDSTCAVRRMSTLALAPRVIPIAAFLTDNKNKDI
jgi:hypothetical protein